MPGFCSRRAAADQEAGPIDLQMFQATFDTNVFGAVAVTQAFLPLLSVSLAGRIVNISSKVNAVCPGWVKTTSPPATRQPPR
jgi:NAD(P)-dependent dehydrogenase (short-subunit alcohol dehydrogenase family)